MGFTNKEIQIALKHKYKYPHQQSRRCRHKWVEHCFSLHVWTLPLIIKLIHESLSLSNIASNYLIYFIFYHHYHHEANIIHLIFPLMTTTKAVTGCRLFHLTGGIPDQALTATLMVTRPDVFGGGSGCKWHTVSSNR